MDFDKARKKAQQTFDDVVEEANKAKEEFYKYKVEGGPVELEVFNGHLGGTIAQARYEFDYSLIAIAQKERVRYLTPSETKFLRGFETLRTKYKLVSASVCLGHLRYLVELEKLEHSYKDS